MPHSTSPIGTDIQDGGYELPRIPLLGTSVNKFVAKVASIHRDFIADSYIFDVCCGKAGKGAAMNENPHD
jgi:hypothetical protein